MSAIQTLNKNCIKNFILRIDFANALPFTAISNAINDLFIRREERQVDGFRMRFDPARGDVVPVIEKGAIKENLFIKADGCSLVLSPIDFSLVIVATRYKDKSVYEDILNRLVSVDWKARRVGLRYVNLFECPKAVGIGKILNAPYADVVKRMVMVDSVSRAISVQSRTTDQAHVHKIQFGVPNSGFPKRISSYDILLDIDAFYIGEIKSEECSELVADLNHEAYSIFTEFVTDRQVGVMQ